MNWNQPDHFLVALIITDTEQVHGMVSGSYGLLKGVPHPDTGLCYLDVVVVEGPIGEQKFRDEFIYKFRVNALHQKSIFKTFGFRAQIPNGEMEMELRMMFEQKGLAARIPWTGNKDPYEWKDCFCAASSKWNAKYLLVKFILRNWKARIKDFHVCLPNHY